MGLSNRFLPEKVLRVGDIEFREVQSALGVPLAGHGELSRQAAHHGAGIVFDDADAGLGGASTTSRQCSSTLVVKMLARSPCKAVWLKSFSLTSPAMVWLAMKAPEASAPMVVRSNSPGVALMRDEKAALVDDQRAGGVGLREKFPERLVQLLDVLLDELGQGGHVMRIAGRLWLMNFCSSIRVIMLRLSNTPSHLCAVPAKEGTCTSRLFSRKSRYSIGAAFGRSRLLYWST